MKFNIAQLLKDPIGSTRAYPVDGWLEVAGEPAQPVSGRVHLLRTDQSILVRGLLTARITSSCSRCLSPFQQEVSFALEEEFFPVLDVNSGAPLPLPEESEPFIIDEYHILDLTEAVRQQSLLALPMKPLCRPGCAGLCHHCGHNLNQGPCQCDADTSDPRWEALHRWAAASGLAQVRVEERG